MLEYIEYIFHCRGMIRKYRSVYYSDQFSANIDQHLVRIVSSTLLARRDQNRVAGAESFPRSLKLVHGLFRLLWVFWFSVFRLPLVNKVKLGLLGFLVVSCL